MGAVDWATPPRTVMGPSGRRRALRHWRAALGTELAALAAQVVAGAATDAYGRPPATHPGSARLDPALGFAGGAWRSLGWAVAHGGALLRLHVALAAVAVVAAAVTATQARRAGGAARTVLAWTALLGVVGASVAGAGVLTGGPEARPDTVLMAVGLAVAAAASVGALAVERGRR